MHILPVIPTALTRGNILTPTNNAVMAPASDTFERRYAATMLPTAEVPAIRFGRQDFVKRLLIIRDYDNLAISGAVTQALQLGKFLPDRGIDVRTFQPSNITKRVDRDHTGNADYDGTSPIDELISTLRDFNPDGLLIMNELEMGTVAQQYALEHHIPHTTMFTTAVEYYEKMYHHVPTFPSLGERPIRDHVYGFHKKADRVWVYTEKSKAELVANGVDAQKIVVIGGANEPGVFGPEKADPGFLRGFQDKLKRPYTEYPRPYFLYVGRIGEEKPVARILDLNLDGTLIIAGRGPQLAALKESADHRDNVIFLDRVDHAKLPTVFASSDVFLFPSNNDTFGYVVIEAMESGLPVVALDTRGPGELVEHGETGVVIADGVLPDELKGRLETAAREAYAMVSDPVEGLERRRAISDEVRRRFSMTDHLTTVVESIPIIEGTPWSTP